MKRFLLPAVLLFAACDASPPPQPEVEREPDRVFESQIRAMDRAREAEAQTQATQAARQQQLDAAAQ